MTDLSSDKAKIHAIDLLLRLQSLDSDTKAVIEVCPKPGGPQVWLANLLAGTVSTKYECLNRLLSSRRSSVLDTLASRKTEAETMLAALLDQELKLVDAAYAELSAAHASGVVAASALDKLGDAYTSALIAIAAAKHPLQRVTRNTEPFIIGEIRGLVTELRWRATAYSGAMDMFCDHQLIGGRFPTLQTVQLGAKPESGIACMADLDPLQANLRSIKRSVTNEQQRLGRVLKTLLHERLARQQQLREQLEAPFVS